MRGSLLFFSNYLPRPEPGPRGVSVDPLGEAFGASVFPDGFIVLFGLVLGEPLEPAEPVALPVVPLFVDEPIVDPVAEVPPAEEPPPAAPPAPPPCASANVLESANAIASAIVLSFMASSFSSFREAPTRRPFARSINSSSRDRSRQKLDASTPRDPLRHIEREGDSERGTWPGPELQQSNHC